MLRHPIMRTDAILLLEPAALMPHAPDTVIEATTTTATPLSHLATRNR